MVRLLRAPAAVFARGKGLAVAALTVGLLLWFVAFLCVGAQWFLMWQSSTWSGGQEAAFRLFACLMLILLYVSLPDPDLGTNVGV